MGGVIKSVGNALGFTNSSAGLQGGFTDAQKRASDQLKAQQANEASFANQLAQGALGQGPSVVDMQLKAAQDRTLAQQLAAARSTRSVNPALAMRNIQQAAGQQNAELAQAGATGRIQEQRAQQSDYGNYLSNLRNTEANALNAAAANAARSDQANNAFGSGLLNAAASGGAMAAAALSDENKKEAIKNAGVSGPSALAITKLIEQEIQGGDGGAEALKGVKDTFDKTTAQIKAEKAKVPASFDKTESKLVTTSDKMAPAAPPVLTMPTGFQSATPQLGAGVLTATPQVAPNYLSAKLPPLAGGSSDENKKKDIKEKTGEAKSFLDALTPYTYKYKDAKAPGAGEGRFLGVMAQDLEKAGEVGRSMVKDTPNGKMVDYGKGFGALLATQADINNRLKQLESKKKKV